MAGGSGFLPRFTRAIGVKNRSHHPKTNDTKLQSSLFDQTGRFFWPADGLTPATSDNMLLEKRDYGLIENDVPPLHTQSFISIRRPQNNFDAAVLTAAFRGIVGSNRPVKTVAARGKPEWINIPFLLKKTGDCCSPGR